MLIRFVLTALAVMICFGHPLHAQQDRWSAELVGISYETGVENCPEGVGLGLDFERRTGSPYVAIIGGLRLADAPSCDAPREMRLIEGRALLAVARHLSLIGAPLLGVAVGPDPATFPLPIRPRLRLAILAGKIDAPKDERHPMPLAQAELHARYRSLAILVRTGTIRAPVLLQSSYSDEPETVSREWHWRRLVEAGLRLHW